MSKKATSIVSYITIIGWLIAYFAGDKENAKFYLNQSLVYNIAAIINGWILPLIPVVGAILSTIISIILFVLWIIGLVRACKQQEKPLPIIGGITILK